MNDNNILQNLLNEKSEYQNKLKEIEAKIDTMRRDMINKCKHTWVKEREYCQYGTVWTYCSKCKIDIDKSFIH